MYFDTNLPVLSDNECLKCKWLPMCVGGCPYLRMFYKRDCVPYKDDPESFVMGLYERMVKEQKFPAIPDNLGGSCFSASSSKNI